MNKKYLGIAITVVIASILITPAIVINNDGNTHAEPSGSYPSTIFGSLQQYAEEHGTTVEQLTANWTADDWIRWYKYEGNPSWGSTNIVDQFLATDWVKLPNSGNLTWGANYDYEYKYNSTSDRLEMWHNGTLVSYLGSDDLWHYASGRPNLTDLHHMTDKEYVDNAVASLGARYYMIDTSSGISDYKLTQLSPPSGSEQSVTKTGLTDDDYIAGWISPDTSMSKLIKGVYNWHVYAEKTGGTQTLRLYWQLVERKSDTTETVIATSAVSNEISTSKASYIISLILSEDYTLADGSYIVGKLYADVSDGGSAPDVAIYYDGDSKSHWAIPVNLEIFSDQFLKLDGSNANSDIDITPYNLTVNNISAFNLKSAASYIIWTDGSTIYALNGTTGEIDYSGTDAVTVIQNAIDALPDGGKIIIRTGIYELTNSIFAKSNIIIEGEGLKTIINTGSTVGITIQSGNENIMIRDIKIIGDGSNNGIQLSGGDSNSYVANVTIENVYCENNEISLTIGSYASNIYISNFIQDNTDNPNLSTSDVTGISISPNANKIYLSDIQLIGNSFCGLFMSGANDITANNIITINNARYPTYSDNPIGGIQVAYGSTDVTITNHISIGDYKGLVMGKVDYDCYNVVASGYIRDTWDNGYGDAISIIYSHNCIIDYAIDNAFRRAVRLENSKDLQINIVAKHTRLDGIITDNLSYSKINAILYQSGYLSDNSYNDVTLTDSHHNILQLICFSDAANKVKYNIEEVGGSDYNIITNSILLDAQTDAILKLGENTVIKDNIGYTTENSDSSEITGDGTNTSFSISHGLATTPSQVLITPTNSSMASATWWVSAKSSTTFTITFSTAPSSGTKLSFDWYAEV